MRAHQRRSSVVPHLDGLPAPFAHGKEPNLIDARALLSELPRHRSRIAP